MINCHSTSSLTCSWVMSTTISLRKIFPRSCTSIHPQLHEMSLKRCCFTWNALENERWKVLKVIVLTDQIDKLIDLSLKKKTDKWITALSVGWSMCLWWETQVTEHPSRWAYEMSHDECAKMMQMHMKQLTLNCSDSHWIDFHSSCCRRLVFQMFFSWAGHSSDPGMTCLECHSVHTWVIHLRNTRIDPIGRFWCQLSRDLDRNIICGTLMAA